MSADQYQLTRFVEAQQKSYSRALAELRAGRKTSHWMWFIFPQIKGLGSSRTAALYAIQSIEEAQAYLAHAVLGARLTECTETLLNIDAHSASDIFSYPDDLKFCSSMTLFDYVSPENGLFRQVINKLCAGCRDDRTLRILDAWKT